MLKSHEKPNLQRKSSGKANNNKFLAGPSSTLQGNDIKPGQGFDKVNQNPGYSLYYQLMLQTNVITRYCELWDQLPGTSRHRHLGGRFQTKQTLFLFSAASFRFEDWLFEITDGGIVLLKKEKKTNVKERASECEPSSIYG